MANIYLSRLTWESGKILVQLAVNESKSDIATNTENIAVNTGAIADLVEDLAALVSRVGALESANANEGVSLEIVDDTINWLVSSRFYITLTTNTELFDSNLPENPNTKKIKIKVSGDYTLTLPSYWDLISGSYDGSKDNLITAYCADDTAQTQVDTLTLSGTNGMAVISAAGGLTKSIYFDDSLGAVAAKFVVDNAADYLAQKIVVTSDDADIIFTSQLAGYAFTNPQITDVAGNLNGTVVNTTPNGEGTAQVDTVTLDTGTAGAAEISVAGDLTKEVVFIDDYETSAELFVTRYAADYLAEGIVVTSSGDDIIFTAEVAGTAFDSPVISNVASTLTGTVDNTVENLEPKVWYKIEQEYVEGD